jgi:peptide/nickel transport system substrate-binding protein
MKSRTLFALLAILMVASFGLTACQPAATETPAATEVAATSAPATAVPATAVPATAVPPTEVPVAEVPQSFVYIDNTGFYTLDIFFTPWFSMTQSLMYDTLVTMDLSLDHFIPLLAESWEVAPDNLSVTFKIKPGITFHDGTVLDANALKWNYDKYLDPTWPKEINDQWPTYISGFEVIDDLTLKVNLIQPYAPLFADLFLTMIVSPTAYEAEGQDGFGRAPVGSGPWMPTEIVENQYVHYKANPNYTWGPDFTSGQPPKLQDMEIRFITDEAVSYAALETGEANLILLPSQYLETARSNSDIVVQESIEATTRYLGWNFTKPLYQDIRFRQAIEHAIDRDAIALAGYGGDTQIMYGFVPFSNLGFDPADETYAKSVFTYDPAQSNALLDELGYMDTNGDGTREANGAELVLPIAYAPSEDIQRIAETIQAELADVGIGVELTPMESAAQAEMLVACQQDLFIRQYGLLDPNIVSAMVTPPDRTCWDDATAQEFALAADTTLDPVERKAKVTELNNYMVDQFAWVPLYSPKDFIALRTNLQGVYFDKAGGVYLYDAFIAAP